MGMSLELIVYLSLWKAFTTNLQKSILFFLQNAWNGDMFNWKWSLRFDEQGGLQNLET